MTLQARYTILRKIADGGTAEIFLATQHGAHGFEKTVVLKRIFSSFYADPQFRNMLIDEAHIAMSLNHSNIVQVLDLGEADGQYVLALELVDGWTLDTVLRRARMLKTSVPPALALYITAEVCRALAYAHAKVGANGKPLGIVHRDLSPHNLLLSEQGEVKLTDFGIAKAHNRRESSLGNVIKGKIAYMSPEQASGTTVDARSDLFSVGTLLYVMVCRRFPFDAPTDLEVLLLVRDGTYQPPEIALPGLNPEIYRVIKRALAKSPTDRYQRAEEMLIDVEQVMRVAFRAVGQTELKRWLQDLSMRDGVPPLTRMPPLPSEATSDHRVDGAMLVLKGVEASLQSVSLPPPIPNLFPGRGQAPSSPRVPAPRMTAALLAVPPLRAPTSSSEPAAGGKSRPPPLPPAAIPSQKNLSARPSASPDDVSHGDEKSPASPSRGAEIPLPLPARRSASSWVADAVLAATKRAGITPSPPIGNEVVPPPISMEPPPAAVVPALQVADATEGVHPRGKRARARAILMGMGLVLGVAIVGLSVRACGHAHRVEVPETRATPGSNPSTASALRSIESPPRVGSAKTEPATTTTTLVDQDATVEAATPPSAKTPDAATAAMLPGASPERAQTSQPPAADPSALVAGQTGVAGAGGGTGATSNTSAPAGVTTRTNAGGGAGVAPGIGAAEAAASEAASSQPVPDNSIGGPGVGSGVDGGTSPGRPARDGVAGPPPVPTYPEPVGRGPADFADEKGGTPPTLATVATVAKVLVQMTSTPPGASVELANRPLGQTPTSLKFKVGRGYSVTFRLDGYRPITKRFRVDDSSDQQVTAVLRRETAQPERPAPAATPAPPPPQPGVRNWFQRMFTR